MEAFLSTLSLRRATARGSAANHRADISIHALLAESDRLPRHRDAPEKISIHALLAESDCSEPSYSRWTAISIHALLAESDRRQWSERISAGISIHALLAESDKHPLYISVCPYGISIHALLAESDAFSVSSGSCPWYFYPRSPCGERHIALCEYPSHFLFLSTLSLRRATLGVDLPDPVDTFLSTLSLRRATQITAGQPARQTHFYPRSPCGERPRA